MRSARESKVGRPIEPRGSMRPEEVGGDMDPARIEAFFEAVREADLATVRRMTAKSPELIDCADEHGFTPLMKAVSSSDRTWETIEILVSAGADVRAATPEGYTALHMMIDVNGPSGKGELPGRIARLLAVGGADVEARQHWGWTPLMRAALEGTADELRATVDVGGRMDLVFPDHTLPECVRGSTVLMTVLGDPVKTRILLDAGVDLRGLGADGCDVFEHGRRAIAEARAKPPDADALIRDIESRADEELRRAFEAAGIDADLAMREMQSVGNPFDNLRKVMRDFDYVGEVQASLALIEQAVRRRGRNRQ